MSPQPRRTSCAFLLGALLACAFPLLNQAWLAWLIPGGVLFLALDQPPRAIFRLGWFAGLGHCLFSLHWLLQIPMPLNAAASWLGLSAWLALFPAAWCWVCWRSFHVTIASRVRLAPACVTADLFRSTPWRRRVLWALFCGAAWVAMEMGVSRLLTGFPWNLLGVSQHRFIPLIQIASLTGVYGVSFLVVWTSVALVSAVVLSAGMPDKVKLIAREVALPVSVLTLALLFGGVRVSQSEQARSELKVTLVQPSIPQPAIWDPNETTNRLNKLLDLSHAALAQPTDLLVWPEAAIPEGLGRTLATQDIITALVRRHNVWMIFGGNDTGRKRNADGAEELHRFNTAFLVNPAGDLVSRYHKQHLVVFGEYMPAGRWLPFLRWLRESSGSLTPGWEAVPFRLEIPRAKTSVLICFEDVFPHQAREHVNGDTDFLLNLTNNGWFGEGAAQWQHAANALFRAVENGVPLVRCANNGLTCWIDARGRMHEVYFPSTKNIYQAGVKFAQIPLRPPARAPTIYNRYGDWFGWSCVIVTGLVLASLFDLARTFFQRQTSSGGNGS